MYVYSVSENTIINITVHAPSDIGTLLAINGVNSNSLCTQIDKGHQFGA